MQLLSICFRGTLLKCWKAKFLTTGTVIFCGLKVIDLPTTFFHKRTNSEISWIFCWWNYFWQNKTKFACSKIVVFTLTNSHCLVKLRKNAIFITFVNTLEKLILAFRVEKVTVIPFENQTLWFYHHNISKQCKFRPNFILCTLSCKLVFLSFLNLAIFLSHEKRE